MNMPFLVQWRFDEDEEWVIACGCLSAEDAEDAMALFIRGNEKTVTAEHFRIVYHETPP